MQSHNVIALDYGDRRIGVVLASIEARIASPLTTIDQQDHDNIIAGIITLAHEQSAGTIVVGLPRGMEGQETAQTAKVRAFVNDLRAASGLPVYLQDEAATSILAEEELKASGKQYEKGDIDKLSAYYILNDWLAGLEKREARV